MKVGIAGCGVTGGALKRYLNNTKDKPLVYDPGKDLFDDIWNCDVIFICVPVPTVLDEKNNAYDMDFSALEDVMNKIKNPHCVVAIRSTVRPGTCKTMSDKYGLTVISMPEFLTERRADEDMRVLPVAIGVDDYDLDLAWFRVAFNVELVTTTKAAEFSKLIHNGFCGIKVHFWNVVKLYCEEYGLDFTDVKIGSNLTGFLGPSEHKQVPGHDGQYGYGGACIPKDIKTFFQCVREFTQVPILVDIEAGRFRRAKGAKNINVHNRPTEG